MLSVNEGFHCIVPNCETCAITNTDTKCVYCWHWFVNNINLGACVMVAKHFVEWFTVISFLERKMYLQTS